MASATLPRKRRPDFVVKESHKFGRIGRRWRYPGGRHSPVRQMHRGRPAMPTPGYGAPASIRGLHPSGRKLVVIRTARELAMLDKEHVAVLGGTLGGRKKIAVLGEALKKGIGIFGINDIPAAVKELQDGVTIRKKAREEKQKAKEEKKKAAEKKKKPAKEEKRAEPKEKEGSAKEAAPESTEGKEKGREEQESDRKEQEKELLEQAITRRQ